MRKTKNPTDAEAILQAMLDMFEHPVWITDGEGNITMNDHARRLTALGFELQGVSQSSITLRGKRYAVHRRAMNRGTGCTLLEMRSLDDQSRRLRESTQRLDAALAQHA